MTTTAHHPTDRADDGSRVGGVRCSDVERERTSSALQDAAGEGRLTIEEIEERLTRVYSARYRDELDDLTSDLPDPEPDRAGWAAAATLARRQLVDDMDVLTRRGPGVSGTGTRVLYTVGALLVVLFVIAMVLLALYGIVDEGPGHHGVGRS